MVSRYWSTLWAVSMKKQVTTTSCEARSNEATGLLRVDLHELASHHRESRLGVRVDGLSQSQVGEGVLSEVIVVAELVVERVNIGYYPQLLFLQVLREQRLPGSRCS
jgi:hypothetical protein